jgi:hypothetical protein
MVFNELNNNLDINGTETQPFHNDGGEISGKLLVVKKVYNFFHIVVEKGVGFTDVMEKKGIGYVTEAPLVKTVRFAIRRQVFESIHGMSICFKDEPFFFIEFF